MFISMFSDIKNRLEGRKQGWTNAHSFFHVTGPPNMCQYTVLECPLGMNYVWQEDPSPIFCQMSVAKFRPSTAAESLGLLLGRVWNRSLEHGKD